MTLTSKNIQSMVLIAAYYQNTDYTNPHALSET